MTDEAPKTGLVKYDAMVTAIDICHRVDEAVEIRNQASALKLYMRMAGNREAERKAAEIRIRAERKVGLLTREMETKPGARTDRQPPSTTERGSDEQPSPNLGRGPAPKRDILHEAGISSQRASEWERLADIPDDKFETAMAESEMPTTTGILATTALPKAVAIAPRAMKIWSLCKALSSDGYLAQDPATVLATMSAEMLDDMHRLAPEISRWFASIGKVAHD
jgi:hypothetical protein